MEEVAADQYGKTKEKRQYVNENQQNIMRVFEYLAQDILEPKTVQEIGDALNLSKDQAFRTLWNLMDRGWVEDSARGYRISPKITTYGERMRLAVSDTLEKYLHTVINSPTRKQPTLREMIELVFPEDKEKGAESHG